MVSMGVQACRLPAFQRFKCFKSLLERPTTQAKASPRPPQNCFLWASKPAVCQALNPKTLKTLKTLNHPLGTPNPAGNTHINGTMGVQACRFPAFKPLKCLKNLLERPIAQAKAAPRPDQWLPLGVQACCLPAFKRFKCLQNLLERPTVQAKATPRPHHYPKTRSIASMGVQACRLPAFQRFKCFKSLLEHPTAQAKASPRPLQNCFLWASKPAVCQALNP